MACGSKYENLVRVAGGFDRDNPFGMWCGEPNAELWYAQARHVYKLQFDAWNVLMAIENDRGEYPYVDKLRGMAEAYDADVATLPEPSAWMFFGTGDCAEIVGQYIASIDRGACVLETLNDAVESYGAAPVSPGGGGAASWSVPAWLWGAGAVVVAGAGLAAYAYWPDGDDL